MKIKSIELLTLTRPKAEPKTKGRRPHYNTYAKRAYPIHKYAEFPRDIFSTPGRSQKEVWVRITADDGTWGIANSKYAGLVAPIISTYYTPLLVGRDALAIGFINDLMWRASMRFGAQGPSALARSVVDLALWDLKGKLLKQPVYNLIGGKCRDEITCYVTTDDLDWAMELGFKAFKISNPAHYSEGTAGINAVVEKVAKAREQVGPDADLMINPVMSFNVETAARLMTSLLPYRLRWFEEPLLPSDSSGLEQLKREVPTLPIATGEDHQGRQAFLDLVERRCADILQPDMNIVGGLSETIAVYRIGEAAGLPTIPHAGAHLPYGQHFAVAFPETPWAEYWMNSDPGIPLEETDRIPGTPVPVNGKVVPSDAPGFGIEYLESDFAPL